jgi:hypothetical protein
VSFCRNLRARGVSDRCAEMAAEASAPICPDCGEPTTPRITARGLEYEHVCANGRPPAGPVNTQLSTATPRLFGVVETETPQCGYDDYLPRGVYVECDSCIIYGRSASCECLGTARLHQPCIGCHEHIRSPFALEWSDGFTCPGPCSLWMVTGHAGDEGDFDEALRAFEYVVALGYSTWGAA